MGTGTNSVLLILGHVTTTRLAKVRAHLSRERLFQDMTRVGGNATENVIGSRGNGEMFSIMSLKENTTIFEYSRSGHRRIFKNILICVHVCAMAQVWKSEDNFWELAFCFHHGI